MQALMSPLSQGQLTIERMCELAGISRAGYYRHFEASAPREAQTDIRAEMQRISAENIRYGYRRIAHELRREGFVVNHKKVLRLMRDDNLLCLRHRPFVPVTTLSKHEWQIVPNLARDLVTTGINQLWVADITYVRLLEELTPSAVGWSAGRSMSICGRALRLRRSRWRWISAGLARAG
jgi:putative transposase